MNAKQAAAYLREKLAKIQSYGGLTQAHLARPNGEELFVRLPSDVHFAVRATKSGVNITIEDRGYVDRVTGGDPSSFGDDDYDKAVVAEVERVRNWFFNDLPGETKWGPIIISATTTGWTEVEDW